MRIKWTVLIVALTILSEFAAQAQENVKRAELTRWQKQQQAFKDDPDVIAYYDFQEGKGDTLKNMSKTGTGLDGKIQSAKWAQGRWPGKNALSFDGSKSLVEIPSAKALFTLDKEQGGTGEMTIELWLNAKSNQEGGLVDKSSAGTASDAPYSLWISPHRLSAYMGRQPEEGTTTTSDSEQLIMGDWIHVAMVINEKSLALYRDGVLVGRVNRGPKILDNDKPLLLGSMGLPGRYYYDGLLDEVVIYKKALPESTIKAHAGFYPSPSGPASITLNTPKAGDHWDAGSQHYITWESKNLRKANQLKIEYSTDAGKNWQLVGPAVNNTHQLLWTVPDTVSNTCLMRMKVNDRDTQAEVTDLFAIDPTPDIPGYKWIKVALPAAFAPRDGAGALVYKNHMWLLGGWNPPDRKFFPRGCNNEVWKSRNGADWTLVRPNTFIDSSFNPELDWEGRHTAGYVVYDDKMWIVGGDANQGHYQFDVWNSSDGKTWNHVNKGKPVPWGPRVLHYTLVYKDRIWVIGGQSLPQIGGGKEIFYRDVWTTTDGINWTQVTPQEPFWPQRGMIGGNVVFKDRMWILGGGTYDTPQTKQRKYFNDVWSSDDGVKWKSHTESAPWAPRQYHEVAVFDDRMWVLEGYGRGNRNDVWHSADGVNWYEVPKTPWKPRHAASVYVFDNALWMVAGNNMQSDVWKLVRNDKHDESGKSAK